VNSPRPLCSSAPPLLRSPAPLPLRSPAPSLPCTLHLIPNFEFRQIGAFAGGVVVVVEVVQPDDGIAPGQQRLGHVAADEAGGAGDEDGFAQGAASRMLESGDGRWKGASLRPLLSSLSGWPGIADFAHAGSGRNPELPLPPLRASEPSMLQPAQLSEPTSLS